MGEGGGAGEDPAPTPRPAEIPVDFCVCHPNPDAPFGHLCVFAWAPLVAQSVKNLPAVRETWVRSLGWEDLLEEGMATHSSILAWRIPMDFTLPGSSVHGVAKNWT